MKNLYNKKNSKYLELTGNWHKELSPWKADQIHKLIIKNNIEFKSVVEVGCGAGEILHSLNNLIQQPNISYTGYDIAPDAIELTNKHDADNVTFVCEDFTTVSTPSYDVLLMIDVFEHVPDYLGFIESCRDRATYKIFHIPLDIHLSSLLRNKMIDARNEVGHLHYFTKESALATLEDCGYEVIDSFYTKGSVTSKKLRSKVANIPRALIYPVAKDLAVKLFGGYSLLVLTK